MCDLLVCRVCLASDDVKLYNIYKFNLIEAYKNVIGDQVRIILFLGTYYISQLKKKNLFSINYVFAFRYFQIVFSTYFFFLICSTNWLSLIKLFFYLQIKFNCRCFKD